MKNYRSPFPANLLAAIFFLSASTAMSAQSVDTEGRFELREAFEFGTLFDGRIDIGRTHTKLYIGGEAVDQVEFKSFNDKKEILEFEYDEAKKSYKIDYLELPIIDMTLGGRSYRLTTELIQVDWPGNEINWRMIPVVTYRLIE